MAIASQVDLKNPKRSKFVPFCKVGTGYSLEALKQLRDKLRPCMRPYNNTPPDYWPSWAPSASERPDYVVADPSKSVLLECRGAELVRTEKFAAGICLRFPKVSRLRLDKSWSLCMTVAEVQSLTQSLMRGDQPTPSAEVRAACSPPEKRRCAGKRTGEVAMLFKDTDTSHVQSLSQLFVGHEFFFLTLRGCPQTKEDLERLVVQHGGTKVQNCLKSTTDVVASDENVLKVRNFIQAYNLDIKKPEWVQACVDAGQLVVAGPRYLLHTSTQTRNYFEACFSPYGDSYFVDFCSAKDLIGLAMALPLEVVETQIKRLKGNWQEALPEDLRAGWANMRTHQLSKYQVYVSGEEDTLEGKLWRGLAEVRLTALGASVASDLQLGVTHVLELPGSGKAESWPRDVAVVDVDWLLRVTALH